jgi:hypothetical protein
MPSSQNFNSPGAKTYTSKPYAVTLAGKTTVYTTRIETNIGANGSVTQSKIILQDQVTGRSGSTPRELASSTDGGKTWTVAKDSDNRGIISSEQTAALTIGGKLNVAVKNSTTTTVKSSGATPAQINQLQNGNVSQTPQSREPAKAAPAGGAPGAASPAGGAAPTTGGLDYYTPNKPKEILSPNDIGKGGYLKYPTDMKPDQDRIVFTVLEINKVPNTSNKVTLEKSGFSKTYGPANGLKTASTVILPIQPSISDSNSIDWGSGTLNEIERAFAEASLGTMQAKDKSDLAGVWQGLLNEASQGKGNLQKFGILWAAEQAVSVQGLMSRATGSVLNPNLELLFNGPALRPFSFTFKLSPRSKDEATMVRKIIRFFKENMSVRKGADQIFVKSPYVFRIMYNRVTNTDKSDKTVLHKSINRIKTCALQSFNVDYTPLGSYMTYDDPAATMVSYNISLQFTEIEPVYNTDYDMASDEIGY